MGESVNKQSMRSEFVKREKSIYKRKKERPMDHITPFHLKSETTMYVHARNMRRHKMCGVHLQREADGK